MKNSDADNERPYADPCDLVVGYGVNISSAHEATKLLYDEDRESELAIPKRRTLRLNATRSAVICGKSKSAGRVP